MADLSTNNNGYARNANNATPLKLKDVFFLMVDKKIIPERPMIEAEIEGLGQIEDLYSFIWKALCNCLNGETDEVTFTKSFNKLRLVFKYLIDNELIKL